MTNLARFQAPAVPCPVCDGDPEALFKLTPLGFGQSYLAHCPCLLAEQSCGVWRSVLAPYLEKEPA